LYGWGLFGLAGLGCCGFWAGFLFGFGVSCGCCSPVLVWGGWGYVWLGDGGWLGFGDVCFSLFYFFVCELHCVSNCFAAGGVGVFGCGVELL